MKTLLVIYMLFTIGLSFFLFQEDGLKASVERGGKVYADFCINCHLEKGEGVEGIFPPLANSDYLKQNRAASIFGVKYGQRGEIVVNGVTYNNTMMPMGLSDEEVADVMNYILNSWGNSTNKLVTKEEVATVRVK